MMKPILVAAVAMLAAVPAFAQSSGWASNRLGNQTYYTGQGAAEGWRGNSYKLGNQSYSNFYGPRGQSRRCTSYTLGNQTYTNCN